MVLSREARGRDYIQQSRNLWAQKSRNETTVPAGAVTETMTLSRDAGENVGPAEQRWRRGRVCDALRSSDEGPR